MGDKRNFAALDWVIGEIDETLKDARQALEAYVEDTRDSTRIRFCLTHIHQVHGSLQMVEFHGASLLAEEMEQLAQAIMNNAVASAAEAQEVLMRSLLQLPIYLDHVKTQKEDQPGVVLPLLNDLRAVRKQSYLSETNLFSPDLSIIKAIHGKRHPVTGDKAKLGQVLKKLREMYQFAAAGVLRGIKIEENLTYLDKVCGRMEALTLGTACYPTWEVSAALIEAVRRDDVELSVAVRGLLRYLARELRILGEKAPPALDLLPRESLLKNLLYYVARAKDGSARVKAVKERYCLSRAILNGEALGIDAEADSLSAPDPDAIRSVVVALNEEIATIRNVLDVSLTDRADPAAIADVLPVVKRVADTLAVLGIGDLRKQVVEQLDHLEKLAAGNSLDQAQLLQVAGKIVEIEQRLEAIAKVVGTNRDLGSIDEREVEIDQAKVTVIKECQHGLEQTKDAIVAYYSSKWDKVQLQIVGSLLTNIRGGLEMIPLRRAAAIIDSCNRYVQNELLEGDKNPSWKSLETFADAIACVEYFLERLLEDVDDDSMLILAEQSVKALDYPVINIPAPELNKDESKVSDVPPTADSESTEQAGEKTEASGVVVELPVSPTVTPEPAEKMPEPETDFDENQHGSSFDQWQEGDMSSPQVVEKKEEAPAPLHEVGKSNVESSEDNYLAKPTEPVEAEIAPAEPEPVEESEPQEESDIDDEIIEIFIEEAGEVSETLEEYFPQWKANFQDQDALVVVRRAFHTLKGSGRMVEAYDIGELAWSVENMLNRIIDNTVKASDHHVHLIERVLSILPSLINAFAHQKPNPNKGLCDQYMAWGEALSKGELPADLENAEADEVSQTTVSSVQEEAEEEHENLILWEIFSSEAASHLQTVEAFITHSESDSPIYSPPTDDLQRALHTLKGSAKMAQVTPIAAMAEPLEHFAKELISYQIDINADILQLLRDAVSYTKIGLDQISSGQEVNIPKLEQFLARAAELRELSVGPVLLLKDAGKETPEKVDPRLLSIFMAEEMKLLLDAEDLLRRWQHHELVDDEVKALVKELGLLEAGAGQANLPELAHLSRQLQTLHDQASTGQQPLVDDFFDVVRDGHEALLDMVDCVAAGQNVSAPSETITAALDDLINAGQSAAPTFIQEEEAQPFVAPSFEDYAVGDAEDIDQESGAEIEADDIDIDFGFGESEKALDTEAEATEIGEQTDPSEVESSSGALNEVNEEEALSGSHEDSSSLSEESLIVEEPGPFEVLQDASDLSPDLTEQPVSPEISDVLDNEADSVEDGEELLEHSESESVTGFVEPSSSQQEQEDTASASLDESPSEFVISDEVLNQIEPVLDESHQDSIMQDDEIPLVEGLSGEELPEQNSEEIELGFEEPFDQGSLDQKPTEELPLDEEPTLDFSGIPLPTDDVESIEAESEFEPLDLEAPDQAAVSEGDELGTDLPKEEIPQNEIETEDVVLSDPELEPELEKPNKAVSIPGLLDDLDAADEDYDVDILEVFIEEAEELIEDLDEAVHAWESDWGNLESPEEIKRVLHTLKGGARLAGLMNLGELTHEYESYLMGLNIEAVDNDFFKKIHGFQDKVLLGVRAVQTFIQSDVDQASADVPAELIDTVESDADLHQPEDTVTVEEQAPEEPTKVVEPVKTDNSNVLPFAVRPKPTGDDSGGFTMPSVSNTGGTSTAAAPQLRKSSGPQEVIKVSAELLEELVNLAGETSISRGRLEEQVSEFGGALDEIDGTLDRLQEQLRRLDIETEAQILFRQEQMAQHEDFDPLEMDRYSSLQQLSRSLTESASDLFDLKATIQDKLRDTETILLQQSRINTTLQEGLMRSRMVPFSRLVPRLRRIVRQIATELGKSVSFELDNIEGELDRSVLERMIPPLEHMLRNAVDHGIEMPEARIDAGKPETGRIVLTLGREGGDVLLRLADDGQGINLRRVREKAIERGLMTEDAELSDYDVTQFILHAGFSTAENVTQISGRGVGMDVVSAEIKQLGGSVAISSEWGKGTEFVVRLPFTVSVNRALMVGIGQDAYAVPLNTIEGIVRVSPYELEHYYSTADARFEYAGENYQVRYLGAMLSSELRPRLDGQSLPLPVLLVRSAEHTMAIQVDAVMGSREIVVKSLGSQFSLVQGMSGATVMGDGSVVVILDPHALVRKEMALSSAALALLESSGAETAEPEVIDRVKTIMVVDDSVTVRKVTTRFLEREGYNVITAKDGVDALRILQDDIPDLMLLDIEMPRMDGFEVAKNVRGTRRWKHIPIIMITSRTGEKHREHAISLGVNGYLGKPYQEDLLLKEMSQLLEGL